MPRRPRLIVLAGLPGSGKSTIARGTAMATGAVHLRIDTIETAMREALDLAPDMRDSGYRVAYAIAGDLLAGGHDVIADCVNAFAVTRSAWHRVADESGADCLEIGILCSELEEHEHRITARKAAASGGPDWDDVTRRAFEPIPETWHRIETAGRAVEACVAELSGMIGPG